MNTTILVIDDDQKLNNLLKEYLSNFGYDVVSAITPSAGLGKLRNQNVDLIILDVMLPEMDGFDTLKEIRKEYNTPVIMLTARGEVTDRIVGLEIGADDYLPKPFEPRELVARIQSILRRNSIQTKEEVIKVGELVVDLQKQSAILEGHELELTTAEFTLLALFAKKAGRVLNRDLILDNLKGITWEIDNRSVDVLISRLRQKLGDDPKNPKYIKTVWGSGYKFIGE